jgi:ATP-binding cassette subfamily B protein
VTTAPATSGWRIFCRLLREQRAYVPRIVTLLVLNLLSAPLMLLGPLAIKIAVDSYVGDEPLPAVFDTLLPFATVPGSAAVLWVAVALVLLVAVLSQVQGIGAALLRTATQERLTIEFRSRLFPHVARLSLAYHDRRGSSDSSYRILYDTAMLPSVLIDGIIPFASAAVLFVGMIVVIACLSWKLALVALAVSPLLVLITVRYGLRLRRQWHDVKQLDSSALSMLQEAFGAVRVVKAFGREEAEREGLVAISERGMGAKIEVARTRGLLDAFVAVTMALGTAAVLWIGMRQVTGGALTLGELLMVLAYLAQLYAPLQMLIGHVAELQGALASADRALSLLDETPEVQEAPDAVPLARAEGRIELEHVSFAYDERSPILTDVSATIEAGSRVGIVGETGAGKTTFVNLLTRLYDPTGGRIRLDGRDLREYRLADLRRQFGIVLQDPVLFSRSIAENIAYGEPGASRAQIERAAALAGAHEFIERLPDGYQTVVGERGMRMSGGERQRISIARAFLRDAPILLMDEPTSSVDVRTEAGIVAALDRLMANRTAILITHRESTLIGCERILVLENGRVRPVEPK